MRLNITLDEAQASKLRRLAEHTNVPEDMLAASLLADALEEMDADRGHVANLLDAIPGAFDRAQLGLEQARRGETVLLDRL